jgi:Transglutaminase-like superfamily
LFSTLRDRLWALSQLRDVREAVLLARVGAFAAVVPLLMRLPLPRLARVVTAPPRRRRPSAGEVDRLERVVTLAPRVGRPLVRSGCLTRGLTLYWFLRRAGLDVELRFGLDSAGATDGHCWLTLDGTPFLEKVDPRPRFAETYRLPLTSA